MEWAYWTVGGQVALPPLHRSLDTQAGRHFCFSTTLDFHLQHPGHQAAWIARSSPRTSRRILRPRVWTKQNNQYPISYVVSSGFTSFLSILFSPLVGTRRRGKEPLVLFGLQFDSDISDLTSGMPALPALWQHRLPCGRVVVEHEMCGYCGPISLKILWSPPPETEEAIRK